MDKVIRVGLDTSKRVFVVHGVDVAERPVLRRKLRRGEVLSFFARLPPTWIGLEACGGSHHWARVLARLGHEVRLLPPQYVKAYVKRGKNDAAGCGSDLRGGGAADDVVRAGEEPGPAGGPDAAQGAATCCCKQRTMLVNAIRGHAAEFGVCAAQGLGKVEELLKQVAEDEAIPALARGRRGYARQAARCACRSGSRCWSGACSPGTGRVP